MDITPPFGFGEIVPLEKHHRLRRDLALPAFYATQNAVPVSIGEFGAVMRDLPIVFAPIGPGPEPTGFMPVAVCGLAAGENLLYADGHWENGLYLPAYLRRHPFCVAVGRKPESADKNQQPPALLCVEKSALADDGEALFDTAGKPTEAWTRTQAFINEVEGDFSRSQQFAKLLHDFKLMEAFSMNSTLADGQQLQVTGMFRVSEDKLKTLPADQLRMLIERGAMRLIYLHLASLARFPALIERRVRRSQAAPAAAPATAAAPTV